MKVDLTKMTVKSEVRKENEQVQQEVDDDRRHVIQVKLCNIELLFLCLGRNCPHYEDTQSSQTRSIGFRGFGSVGVPLHTKSPIDKEVH
jgi:hypothetical protein